MKAREKFARVRYVEDKDEFVLELYDDTDGEWNFCCSCRCVEGKDTGNGKDFIHFSFMKECVRASQLGFQFV